MQYTELLIILLAASTAAAMSNLNGKDPNFTKRSRPASIPTKQAPKKRVTSKFLTNSTASFAVNGSALPEVDFNIGESYAGTLPISSNTTDENRLWFWFFPSENPLASNEITVWLNGGPGCSSLIGLLQENGPFLWQPGTSKPVANPYSWVDLTNMIWIDQPISTGFSTGTANVTNHTDVANQFQGFWKNFIDTFDMRGYNIYFSGESWAGKYIPYIASGMLDKEDTEYFNVKGIQLIDPAINYDDAIAQAPVAAAVQYYQRVLNLNDTFMANITARADSCGYTEFLDTYATTFPPPGPIPTAPDSSAPGCSMRDDIKDAATYVNPCFNIYHITHYCPFLSDVLLDGPDNYFNRTDVQEVIHAPPTDYFICGAGPNVFPLGATTDLPSNIETLPSVIERTNNTIIAHGLLDFLIFANGSLVTIQNMTWNGYQGFQTAPSTKQNFFVPYSLGFTDPAGAGFQGTTHTERGLTWVTVALAGHEMPQYAPGAAYRQLEFLLGRIDSLDQVGDYTTRP